MKLFKAWAQEKKSPIGSGFGGNRKGSTFSRHNPNSELGFFLLGPRLEQLHLRVLSFTRATLTSAARLEKYLAPGPNETAAGPLFT